MIYTPTSMPNEGMSQIYAQNGNENPSMMNTPMLNHSNYISNPLYNTYPNAYTGWNMNPYNWSIYRGIDGGTSYLNSTMESINRVSYILDMNGMFLDQIYANSLSIQQRFSTFSSSIVSVANILKNSIQNARPNMKKLSIESVKYAKDIVNHNSFIQHLLESQNVENSEIHSEIGTLKSSIIEVVAIIRRLSLCLIMLMLFKLFFILKKRRRQRMI